MIPIFVGTSKGEDDKDAERVLEYSLRANTSADLNIIWMRNIEGTPFGGHDDSDWWTPFSKLRWAIPEYMNYDGKAVYLDVDQVNFRDISRLYHINLGPKIAATRKDKRACVMVMDTSKMKNIKGDEDLTRANLKFFSNAWNCLDGEDMRVSQIKHLHFTDMRTQPWKPKWPYETWKRKGHTYEPAEHPRQDLVYIWNSLLEKAKDSGL